jgi:hypothetical protein
MLPISLLFLTLACITGLIGAFGFAGNTWESVRFLFYIFLLLPIAAFGFVAFRHAFSKGSQSAVRGFMCVLLIYFVLAFLV